MNVVVAILELDQKHSTPNVFKIKSSLVNTVERDASNIAIYITEYIAVQHPIYTQ
mgnify:CR=1 FL=1